LSAALAAQIDGLVFFITKNYFTLLDAGSSQQNPLDFIQQG